MKSAFDRRGGLRAATIMLVLSVGVSILHAAPRYEGRLLVDVLNELQDAGLDLIFSTAVVGKELLVDVEPTATRPRRVLDQILEPLNLEAQSGPSGSILILPRDRGFGSLSGRVVSGDAGVPIGGATVRLRGTPQNTRCGADGTFRLARVPAVPQEVIVGAFGFEPGTISNVDVRRDRETKLEIVLQSKSSFMTEIVVTPNRHSVTREEPDHRRGIDDEEARLVPSIAGDVSRVVEALPGVSSSDNSAAFHIRGSEVEDVSVILDGLELYDPFHLRSFQSPFSLVDNNIVDRIEFLGGGFTADLGDRHGGFIEISTFLPEGTQPNAVEFGSMKSGARFGGQTGGGAGAWLVALRAWYPEAFYGKLELGAGEKLDPRLADLYTKASFTISPRTVLSVHGLLAYDRLSFVETSPDPAETLEAANALTRTGYLWFRAQSAWSAKLSSATLVSLGHIQRRRGGTSIPDEDTNIIVSDNRDVDFVGIKHDTTWQVSDSQLIKAGLDVRGLDAKYRYVKDDLITPSGSTSTSLDPVGTSVGVYGAYRVRVAESFATEVGLRWDRQAYTDDNQLSPRLNAVWYAGPRSELRFAVGRFNQSQRIHELHVEDGETEFLRAEVSKQAELTFQHTLRGGMNVRVDAYHRKLTKQRPRYENLFRPLELFPETGADRVKVTADRTVLEGIELLVKGKPDRSLTWWASYTLSSADDEIAGSDVPRSWDQTHSGKFLVGYRWGERWAVSLGGSAHTGWPTTPIFGVVVPQPGGSTVIEERLGERNSDRYPAYLRLDAKVRRSIATSKGKLSLALEVFNLTDRQNVCCVDEAEFTELSDGSVKTDTIREFWLGITPSINLLWEF